MNRKEKLAFDCWKFHYSLRKHTSNQSQLIPKFPKKEVVSIVGASVFTPNFSVTLKEEYKK